MDNISNNRSNNESINPRTVKGSKPKPTVDLVKRGVIHAASTAEGLAFFRDLMDACNYQRSTLVADPNTGEVFNQTSMVMEGKRSIWLRLRQLIPRDRLILIEIPEPPQEPEAEDK